MNKIRACKKKKTRECGRSRLSFNDLNKVTAANTCHQGQCDLKNSKINASSILLTLLLHLKLYFNKCHQKFISIRIFECERIFLLLFFFFLPVVYITSRGKFEIARCLHTLLIDFVELVI